MKTCGGDKRGPDRQRVYDEKSRGPRSRLHCLVSRLLTGEVRRHRFRPPYRVGETEGVPPVSGVRVLETSLVRHLGVRGV